MQWPVTVQVHCHQDQQQKEEVKHHQENPFWWPPAIPLLKPVVKPCLQTSLVTLGKLRHFFTLSFPAAEVRTMVLHYIPGVR